MGHAHLNSLSWTRMSFDTAPDKVDSAPPLSRIGLNDHKAGMQGLDKEKINQVILEASKGSRYYDNEVRREAQVTQRLESLLARRNKLTQTQTLSSRQIMDREVEQLDRGRDLSHIIVHIDMDAFYAAVEMRDNPSLQEVPMAVGSSAMLSTSNYIARKFGVRAAMPGFIAKKLCPQLVIVGANFDKYRAVSQQVQDILISYDQQFSPMGLDESYLDITDFVAKHHDRYCTEKLCKDTEQEVFGESTLPASHWQVAEAVVEEIRSRVAMETGLTASAGIAPNTQLAKMASEMNKPNGQFLVTPTREGVLMFVRQSPIRKVFGIGRVTERILHGLGVTNCQELFDQRAVLNLLFPPTSAQHFLRIAMAIGPTNVQAYRNGQRKSVSTERTFAELSNEEDLLSKCRELCESLAVELSQEGLAGRNITVKMKNINFEVRSRGETLSHVVSSADDLYESASQLLRAEIKACSPTPLRLRLMGVRISMLQKTDTNDTTKLTHFFTPITEGPQQTSSDHAHQTSSECDSIHCLDDTDKAVKSGVMECPVCGRELPFDNSAMNRHIDECLSVSALEEAKTSSGSVGGTKRLAISPLRTRTPHKKQCLRTLESFWK